MLQKKREEIDGLKQLNDRIAAADEQEFAKKSELTLIELWLDFLIHSFLNILASQRTGREIQWRKRLSSWEDQSEERAAHCYPGQSRISGLKSIF